jgi:hypothetical protein
MNAIENKIIEKLAELEHEQWIEWSSSLVDDREKLSPERLDRWAKLWIPYSQLTEEQKEQDRIWARKVFKIIFGDKNVQKI